MKKKVKLITTIASLCLAVALMAFGVFAALNVSYTITNTVSYSAAANVKATITYTTEATNVKEIRKGSLDGEVYTHANNKVIFSDTVGDNKGENAAATGAENIGDLYFVIDDVSKEITYKYTVTIVNNAAAHDANKTLVVALTLKSDDDQMATKGYAIDVTGEASQEVAITGSTTYSVLITIKPSSTITAVDLGSAIALSMKA